MIFTLIRETYIELPDVGKRCIDRLPTISFSSLESLFNYTNAEGLSKISGTGSDSILIRNSDLSNTKQSLKNFFKIHSPMKITEQFVVFEQELRE